MSEFEIHGLGMAPPDYADILSIKMGKESR